MDEREREKLLQWYEECDSDGFESKHDPYSTDEDPDYEISDSEIDETSSDSEINDESKNTKK